MLKFALLLILALPLTAFGKPDFNGEISYTQTEKNQHLRNIKEFQDVSAACLQRYKSEHLAFRKQKENCRNGKCLSKFFGSRKYSKKRGAVRADGKKLIYLGDALRKEGFPESYMNKMTSTSCIGMAMQCMKEAFVQTGQEPQWNKLKHFVSGLNHTYGTALLHAIQELGWEVNYWNPSNNKEDMASWEEEELDWDSKGWHLYRYNNVMKNNQYWTNRVDDKTKMVGFGYGRPRVLNETKFWVGIANTGYHVFPGTFADVVEAHSTRDIMSKDNLEFSVFSPFADGGGPKWSATEKYRSGLIALPPK